MSKFFLVFLCGYTPSPLASCAAQIHTTLCGQFVIIFSCCHLRPHNVSCQRARLWRGVLSSRVTVVVVLSAMSKFFLVFLCGDAPYPLATCAAQIHTTLCGQFLLPLLALSCDRARGALPKARFWRDIFCSTPPLGCGIHSHHSLRSILVVNVCFKLRPRKGRLDKSAVSRDIFCSAPPLGCGIHSRLGRQTANNGTSWRLICASRARSRTDVRLGRASRACSPPICTILRRLIKLVCALLRFRERPRTIEVQRTTSSPQNHRKSLAQYSLVLFI